MDALFDVQMSRASDTEILYILGNRDLCQSEKYEAAVAEAKKRKLTYVSFLSDSKSENVEQSKVPKLKRWFGFG